MVSTQKDQKKVPGALKGRVFLFNNSGVIPRWIRRVFSLDKSPSSETSLKPCETTLCFTTELEPKRCKFPAARFCVNDVFDMRLRSQGSCQISTKTHLYRLALELHLKKNMKILNNFLPTLTKAKWNDT